MAATQSVPPGPPARSALGRIIAAGLVFLVAVLLRLPACYESLWVDELHSAWAVWDGWSEVAWRAGAGNQTPWYFYGLWLWKQAWGGSELALRMPSVIATAAACVVLLVAATEATGRLATGVLAGLLLAVENNAIFFGTESRPYAVVLLLTALAAAAAVRLDRTGSNAARATLAAAAFLAVLVHPTAGLPLAGMAAVAFAWSTLGWRRRRRRTAERTQRPWAAGWRVRDLLLVGALMVLALALNAANVTRVWRHRENWSAFGQAQSLADLWNVWPWWPLVLMPLGLWAILRAMGWLAGELPSPRENESTGDRRAVWPMFVWPMFVWPMLLFAAVAITATCWALSRSDVIAIWHPRYFVGVLPLLCWASADLWTAAALAATTWLRRPAWRRWAVVAVVPVAVLAITHWQGTARRLAAAQFQLTARGEDWRGAVQWVRRQRLLHEPLWVAAELIESGAWTEVAGDRADGGEVDAARRPLGRYLVYPVAGPYPLADPLPMGLAARALPSAPWSKSIFAGAPAERASGGWIVVRMSAGRVRRLLRQSPLVDVRLDPGRSAVSAPTAAVVAEVQPFGGVSVVHWRRLRP